MIKRKTISLLLCLLLSMQMLPVVAAGRFFYQNEIAEELHGSDDSPLKSISFIAEMDKYIPHSGSRQFYSLTPVRKTYRTELSYQINAQHTKEVQTPPPNCY